MVGVLIVEVTARESLGRSVDDLKRRHDASGARQIVGIVGAPGTGKSTLAQQVAEQLGADASCLRRRSSTERSRDSRATTSTIRTPTVR